MTDIATPEAQVQQLRADRIEGKVSESDFFSRMEQLGPQLGQPTAPVPSQTDATRAVDELRQRRIDNKITDADFHREMGRLAALAAGETPPVDALTPEQQALADLQAPASASAYNFGYRTGTPETPEAIAFDGALRTTLQQANVPAFLGGPIVDAVEANAMRLSKATPAQIQQHMGQTQEALMRLWGADYVDRTNGVADFIAHAAESNPQLAAIVDRAPHLLSSVEAISYIDSVIQLRANQA